jgi:NADH dehydrogenase FAD-containing subunit
MKEQTVLILGGGIGGVVAANRLRKLMDLCADYEVAGRSRADLSLASEGTGGRLGG